MAECESSYKRMLYREVKKNPISVQSWREIAVNTGGSASTLQDIKVPETSGGYAYLDSGNPNSATSNRFIYWRTSGDLLELVEQSLDFNLVGSHVHYRFQDTPILGGISVHEYHGHVIILVATVTSVHRLVFPHPNKHFRPEQNYIRLEESSYPSIFNDVSLAAAHDSKNFYMINPGGNLTSHLHSASTCLTGDGEVLFAFSTTVGSILLFQMPALEVPGIVVQYEFCQSSMMQRLWTGLVPSIIRGSQEALDMVLTMVMHPIGTDVIVFSVCKDHKLRLWSVKSQECVLACNLLDFTPENMDPKLPALGASGHTIKKVINNGKQYLRLCIYLCFSDRNQFCFLEPSFVDNRHEVIHLGSVFGSTEGEKLIDFCAVTDHLWTLWSSTSAEMVTRVTSFPGEQTKGECWSEVILQPAQMADILIAHHQDPREVYLEKIFQPGRFSCQDILRALNVYKRSLHSSFRKDNVSFLQLREQVILAVEEEIRNSALNYQLEEEEYCQLQLEQWMKFYSCCVQYQDVDSRLKGIFADCCTGLVFCIRKGYLTYFCPCDIVEELYLTESNPEAANALLSKSGASCDSRLLKDVLMVFECMRLITVHVSEEMMSVFEQNALILEGLDEVALQIVDSCLASDDLLVDDINSLLENVSNVSQAVELILKHLDLTTIGQIDTFSADQSVMLTQFSWNHLFAGSMGTSLLIAQLEQFIQTRLSAARDLLLLQTVAVHYGDKARYSGGLSWSLQTSLIPQTGRIIKCYLVIKWISQTVSTPSPTNTIEHNLTQLVALDISESSKAALTTPHFGQIPSTLAELFLQGVGGTQVRSALMYDGTPVIWSTAAIPIVKLLAELMWPLNSNFLFPEFLLCSCQYLHLQEYVRMLTNWCDENEASRCFLLGQSYLHFNEPHKAARCFMEVSEGLCAREPFLLNKLLQADEDEPLDRIEVIYYLKVIRQFEHLSLPDLVISLAERAMDIAVNTDPNVATLYSKAFKYKLELGHNREACNSMATNPDPSRRKDCLRQLLSVLCDRQELQALVEFPFVDMEDDMIQILESRARSVDLAAHNYYDLLYSIHISRNNFRRAGNIMYEYGLRLGHELPGLRGIQRQAQCYLAAINALRLVKPEYAWVVKPVPIRKMILEEVDGTSPKHSLEGEEKTQSNSSNRKLVIVEMKDLEQEYLLVDARLRLIKRDPEIILSSGPTPGSYEMVGLLVNVGLFDKAIIISKIFQLPLNPVFDSLAQRCVTLAQHNAQLIQSDDQYASKAWSWLEENKYPSGPNSKQNSVSDQAWLLLQHYLKRYEEPTGCYHRCTALKLLSHGFALPTWFVNSYKMLNAAELLRLYIDFDLLEEAVIMALEYIDAVQGVIQGYDSHIYKLKGQLLHSAQMVWLPYICLDQLLAALQDHQDKYHYGKLYNELKKKVSSYQSSVLSISTDLYKHMES